MPLIGHKFNEITLTNEKRCKNPKWFYLNLVDVADNSENTINTDTGLCADGILKEYSCPKSITQNVVKVLR